MVTASKVLSAKGSCMPSPTTLGTSLFLPAASMPWEKSQATHQAPDFASSSVDTAVPAARSRTFSPGCRLSLSRVRRRQTRSCPKDSTVLVRSYLSPTSSNIDATSKGSLSRDALATVNSLGHHPQTPVL